MHNQRCTAPPKAGMSFSLPPRAATCPFAAPRCRLQRLLQEHGEVHLSALGVACSSMVTVAEILKARK